MAALETHDYNSISHALVAGFLSRRGYNATLEAFLRESSTASSSKSPAPILEEVLLEYLSNRKVKSVADTTTRNENTQLKSSSKEKYPIRVVKTLDDVHSGPILCVRFKTVKRKFFDTLAEDYREEDVPCLVTSSGDRMITYTPYTLNPESPTPHAMLQISSPALSLAFSPSCTDRIYCSCMDGSVNQYSTDPSSLSNPIWSVKDHTKYAVRVDVSEGEEWLASGGYDGRLCLYQNRGTTEETKWTKRAVLEFDKRVEGILFLPGGKKLAFTLRDDNHLNYLILPEHREEKEILGKEDLEIEKWNLNANGDDWVSFSILSISLHPSGTHVCLQTDTPLSRLILVPLTSPTPNLFRTLYTTSVQSEFSNPRHAWLSTSLVAVGSDDGSVRILDIDGNVKTSIPAHGAALVVSSEGESERVRARKERDAGSSVVRDICALPDRGLATCGFDKKVQIAVVE
ncbi:WD40 repeat-like protein [Atractiella rhizophila]|nr:WD40 repeat-like protein [Atractiella rhizophila]